MSYLDWKVGDKVVCVDGGHIDWVSEGDVLPQEGVVYTVRGIAPWTWGGKEVPAVNGLGIWLQEITRPLGVADDGIEQPYGVERFRPVAKRSTSIEALRALLHPSEHDKKALIEHEAKADAETLADGLYDEVKFS